MLHGSEVPFNSEISSLISETCVSPDMSARNTYINIWCYTNNDK